MFRPTHRSQRGITLLEVTVAMAVFGIGMIGMARMYLVASGSSSYAVRVDRGTSVANDLMSYLVRLPYNTPILVDTDAGNNTDLMDTAGTFNLNTLPATAYDFDETAIPDAILNPAAPDPCLAPGSDRVGCFFQGYIAAAGAGTTRPTLDFNGDGNPDMERYWIVADLPPAPGEIASAGKQIAVVARWFDPTAGAFRRVVAVGYRYNPVTLSP